MSLEMNLLIIFSAIFCIIAAPYPIQADPVEDKQALLDFLHSVHYSQSRLNWEKNSSVCNSWTGVTCSNDHSRVISLKLPGIGFQGPIPTNTLSRLSAIQILNLANNGLSGFFPSDFSKLQNLTVLYLQFNKLSGSLPWNFSAWKNLSILDLSNNKFNGSIPSSVSNLTHLISLNLANNSLSGTIPDINVPSLQELNLANNNLTGIVPPSLTRFPSSAFFGNNLSSVIVLPPGSPFPPHKKSSKLSDSVIVGIALGGSGFAFVVIALLMVGFYSKKRKEDGLPRKLGGNRKGSTKIKSRDNDNRLVFFAGCYVAFDLEDLLTASAEVLGKGTYGTTYRVALEDATTVVVKRLREVTIPKREFEQQMEVVGNIRHENVCALQAYYYSKDEKLMVYDLYEQGSIASLLHDKKGKVRTGLDWEMRLRIAVGAAKGIAHLHLQNNGKLVHGNVKSSNIFLTHQGYGCISDVGLATLISPTHSQATKATGYCAPEITDSRKATPASDVYSLGVFLLELLTGKSPVHATSNDEVVHLVRWVTSVVREEWTAEVFDVELLKYPNVEEELVEMLRIAMSCVTRTPEQRPKMVDVVRMIEEIRVANTPEAESIAVSETNSEIAA